MTTTMEKRRAIRLGVQPDQAQVKVMVNGVQEPGVLVNQSSEGFGLMLQRGQRFDPGHPIRVVSNDGVHECRVCHIRPDDGYQVLGLERIADVPFMERPKKAKGKRWFRYGVGGGMFSGLVLGAGVLGCIWCVWNGPPERTAEERAVEQQATVEQQSPKTDEQQANRERLLELAQSSGTSTNLSAAFFSRLTGHSPTALQPRLASQGLDWDTLTDQLALSAAQQDRIRRLLTSGTATTPATARAQLRSILNGPQKSKVDALAAKL